MENQVTFAGGRNIAMLVPPHQFEATVRVDRDIVGRKLIENHAPSIAFGFGETQFWIDRVPGLSQAESWLELTTDGIPAAS